MEEDNETHIAVFSGKKIRRKLINNKWFFSVVDVVRVLTDSEDPRKYWNKLIQRLREEGSEVVTFCHQLKLIAEDGKLKGYSKDWIDKRLRGIAIRQDLTDEWKNRDIQKEIEFAILTNEISQATFGKNVEEYKRY